MANQHEDNNQRHEQTLNRTPHFVFSKGKQNHGP